MTHIIIVIIDCVHSLKPLRLYSTRVNVEYWFLFHYTLELLTHHTQEMDGLGIIDTGYNKVWASFISSQYSSLHGTSEFYFFFLFFTSSCLTAGGIPLITFLVTP